ncbi:hypothetical protein BANRA_02148 [Acinetobacter baumannii]|nr:hypothetical protein BANRA_02148 [Acinetobacter baumannii]
MVRNLLVFNWKNGIQCQFNKQFRIYLAQLSEGLFPNFDKPIGIEEKQFRKILERSIVNIFTEDGFNIEDDSSKENLKNTFRVESTNK